MAVQKLSQIAAAGGAPAVTDQAVFVTGGATDNLVTVTQLSGGLPLFTSTARGQVPLSGGGTTTFLRADVSFAVPPTFTSTTPGYVPASGGGTTNFLRADGTFQPVTATPGGSSLQIQYNNLGAFGGANVWRTGADQLDLSDAATAQQFRIYKTTDNNGGAPTNGEWATADWTSVVNSFTFGPTASGTGTTRNVRFVGGGIWDYSDSGGNTQIRLGNNLDANNIAGLKTSRDAVIGWTAAGGIATGIADAGLSRLAPNVVAFNSGAAGGATTVLAWYQWAGSVRIDADFNTGNSTVLTNITGSTKNLSVNVAAGRTYSFTAELFTTSNVAAGVQFAIAGTCTATSIVYEALVDDAAAVKAQTRASALGTAVGAITAVTAAHVTITGTITVNAAGTLTVQMAQNVGNATGSVALRGSYFWVFDVP